MGAVRACPECGEQIGAAGLHNHVARCLGESPTVADVHRIGRVDTSGSGCWEWHGNRNALGYGLLPDIATHRLGERRATRAIMRLLGHDLTGLYVCHTCDTPSCVRPSHLFVGSARDNTRDAQEKGRLRPPPLRRSKRARVQKACPACGTDFVTFREGSRVRAYCSAECSRAARRGMPLRRRA